MVNKNELQDISEQLNCPPGQPSEAPVFRSRHGFFYYVIYPVFVFASWTALFFVCTEVKITAAEPALAGLFVLGLFMYVFPFFKGMTSKFAVSEKYLTITVTRFFSTEYVYPLAAIEGHNLFCKYQRKIGDIYTLMINANGVQAYSFHELSKKTIENLRKIKPAANVPPDGIYPQARKIFSVLFVLNCLYALGSAYFLAAYAAALIGI